MRCRVLTFDPRRLRVNFQNIPSVGRVYQTIMQSIDSIVLSDPFLMCANCRSWGSPDARKKKKNSSADPSLPLWSTRIENFHRNSPELGKHVKNERKLIITTASMESIIIIYELVLIYIKSCVKYWTIERSVATDEVVAR